MAAAAWHVKACMPLSGPKLQHLLVLTLSECIPVCFMTIDKLVFAPCWLTTLCLQNPPGMGVSNPSPNTRKARDKWSKQQHRSGVKKRLKNVNLGSPIKIPKVTTVTVEQSSLQQAPEVTVATDLYTGSVHNQMWALLKGNKSGAGPQKKNSFKMDPLPVSLFYTVIAPLLGDGATITVDRSKKNVEYRETTCQSMPKIEAFLKFGEDFLKRKTGAGWANVRISQKKGKSCMHIMVKIVAKHWKRMPTKQNPIPREYAEFEVAIASLNPLATTTFTPGFELAVTPDNLSLLQRYLRAYPVRMRKDGYDVDPQMVNICKAMRPSGTGSAGGSQLLPTHQAGMFTPTNPTCHASIPQLIANHISSLHDNCFLANLKG